MIRPWREIKDFYADLVGRKVPLEGMLALETLVTMAPEPTAHSLALMESATRLLKASTLRRAIDDQDLQNLRAAADAEDHDLPPEELACHVLLREVRKRRQVMMAAVL